jgi:hypothetical protein
MTMKKIQTTTTHEGILNNHDNVYNNQWLQENMATKEAQIGTITIIDIR